MSAKMIRKMNTRQQSLQKTAENRKRVLRTLEAMIEDSVDEETLVESCRILSSSDFEDLNVERSLISICGYPLCSNELTVHSKQKYKISLKQHKVYDLTERKLFCSDVCFTASQFLKKQLREEPFWLSEKGETDVCVEIYKKESGSIGNEVKLRETLNEYECNSESIKLKETKPRNNSKTAGIYFPYVREDQMQKLKDSMSSLTIREKPL